MPLAWHLADMQSGDRMSYLPLVITGDIERAVATKTTLGVTLNVHDEQCPDNWATLIDPARALFVLTDGDHVLAGYYLENDSWEPPNLSFTISSLEGIPYELNVWDHEFNEGEHTDADVAATLLTDVACPSFGFGLVTTPSPRSEDRLYSWTEDQSIGAALDTLVEGDNGLEWTARIDWRDGDRTGFSKWFELGGTIGRVLPATVIHDQHITTRPWSRQYAGGRRATHVTAVSEGTGESRPMSTPAVNQQALDSGVPRWEARISLANVEDDAALDEAAAAAVVRRRYGIRTISCELNALSPGCPRPGRDLDIADTVNIDSGPRDGDPHSWRGLLRTIGWKASVVASEDGQVISTVTPTLWRDEDEEDA